jgi:predicted MFS family arabinose efflux permease
MTTEKPQRIIGALVLAAAAVLLITTGARLSLGLFVQPLSQDMGLSIASISFALAVGQLMWGVSQPVLGGLSDRYGAWPVLFWGTLVLAAGCVLVPLLPSTWGLTATLGVLVAFGAGAGSFSVMMGLVANRVPPHLRGTSSGIINAGGSFGQFLFAPLLQSLIAWPLLGWQGALYALAGISLLVIPLSFFLTRGSQQTKPQVAVEPEQKFGRMVCNAFADRSYWLLHAGFFTCGFHIAFLVTHLPMEVALCGLPPSVASWSLAIIGMANVVGSLLVGWGVGRYRSKWLLFWMYGSRALLIMAYLMMPRTDWTFYLFAVGLGLTWLATVPPTAAIVGKLFGTRYLATLFGLTLLSHQIGGFLGAYLGGLAISHFGDYGWMWYADMALAATAALLNLPIREKKVEKTMRNA